MSHEAGSVYVHCPRCAAEVEATISVCTVEVSRQQITVRVAEYAYAGHECFPAAVAEVRRGRRTSRPGPM